VAVFVNSLSSYTLTRTLPFLMHPRAGLQARGEDLGWVQKAWRIAVVNYLQARVFVVAGPGFEPGLSDSESVTVSVQSIHMSQ
jgi:hypothetical protein